jgi:DNA-binding transcriptional ArsR family regulator
MVKLFKVLANTNRLKILQLLEQHASKPLTVNELADLLPISQGTLSTHLTKMRLTGIIKAKQSGSKMYYSIKDENALKFVQMAE